MILRTLLDLASCTLTLAVTWLFLILFLSLG
jgi:hypothetical protein